MLVHVVYAVTADKLGPDLNRMGKLEEIPDDLARAMLGTGEVRLPTDEELADWEATREAVETGDRSAGPVDVPLPDDAGAADTSTPEENG